MVNTIRESIKSIKQKLYEEYLFDEKGQVKLYSPIVQKLLYDMLEAKGLEAAVKAFDKEVQEEKKSCK